jgi:TPR repeat protein
MARIAAAILPAHIGDGGVGALGLHFERGNQRVLRIDGDAVGFALGDEAYGVMTRHVLNLPPRSIVPQTKMSMRRGPAPWRYPLCISGVDGAVPVLELFSSVPAPLALMLSTLFRSLLVLVLLGALAHAEAAGRRVALVIGNSAYVSVPELDNPSNDAKAMAQQLRDLGFEVTLLLDLDKASFEAKVRDFVGSLKGAEAALFFYAGHGLQVDGRNYMVPVDADVANEADLPFQLVALDIALQSLAAERITNIVILDACRNNPLSEKLAKALGERANAVGKGLGTITTGTGTLISFSTQPGNVALDGEGPDSPFTEALVKHIATPNVTALSMLQDVRSDVVERTKEQQVPWDNSSLLHDFFFNLTKAVPPKAGSENIKQEKDGGGAGTKTADSGTQNGKDKTDGADTEHTPPHESAHDEPDLSHVLPPDMQQSNGETPVLTGKPPVTDCDRIAASATDPERMTEGVTIGALDGAAGVKACRAALAKYPDTARFQFQLARSLQKTEAYVEAAKLYGKLVEHGYFAALVNYGWLLNNGQGVGRNQQAAVKLYLRAAQQGDLFGMFNVAMAYDAGEGLPFNPAQAAAWYAALRLGHDYSIKQMSGSAEGWTKQFRVELQRLKQAGVFHGKLDGVFGPEVWSAVGDVQTLPFAPTPGGMVPTKRWDPQSIPVNAPMPQ